MIMNRRTFHKKSFQALAVAGFASGFTAYRPQNQMHSVRLGGPIYKKFQNPDEWIAAINDKGYRAAYCPVGTDSSSQLIADYERAAKKAGIVIAEVGAWSNPISPDSKMAEEAFR